MPKRYEEEINEILHKFDDWPPSDRGKRARQEAPRRAARPGSGQMLGGVGYQQLMLVGLALVLAGFVLQLGERRGLAIVFDLGVYATALGFLALAAGYILAIVRGSGVAGVGRGQHFWRGKVIDLRPGNRGLGYWWWRIRSGRRPGRR